MPNSLDVAVNQTSGTAPAGVCSRAAYRNTKADPTAETALSVVIGPMITTPSSQSGGSGLGDPTANGSTPSSRPVTAPQKPNRESDNLSNLRRPSAIPSTSVKTIPLRKPGAPASPPTYHRWTHADPRPALSAPQQAPIPRPRSGSSHCTEDAPHPLLHYYLPVHLDLLPPMAAHQV